jgi:glutathione S-transferase
MRARISLWLTKVPVMVYEILLKEKPSALLKLSPKGTVPVLVLDEKGQLLEESLDIMAYAFDRAKKPLNLIDNRHEPLIQMNDVVFKPLLDRYKYYVRFDISQTTARALCVSEFISPLEQRLRNHPYLMGEGESFADLAIFPFVRQFANVEPLWFKEHYPRLASWLQHWVNSEAFQAIMHKTAVGIPTPLLYTPPTS